MTEKSLEARVAALETQLAGKTLEEHFREQSSLIDRLFLQRNAELENKFGRQFAELEKKFDAKLDRRFAEFADKFDAKLDRRFAEYADKFDAKLDSLGSRLDVKLGAIEDAVRLVLKRLS